MNNLDNDNVNERSQYLKDWYKDNKDKYLNHLKEKIDCKVCGIQISRSSQYRHNSSKKHLNNKITYDKINNIVKDLSNSDDPNIIELKKYI